MVLGVGVVERTVAVPRLRLIEDDLLVEAFEPAHARTASDGASETPKNRRTPASPSTKRSTSSSVVYTWALARVDAVMPRARCSGCAQW